MPFSTMTKIMFDFYHSSAIYRKNLFRRRFMRNWILLLSASLLLFSGISCNKEKEATDEKAPVQEETVIELTGETLFIAAKSGLNIREKPSTDAEVVTLVPYGTGVQVVKDDAAPVPMTAEGLKGKWVKVQYDEKTGYAFDGFMISHPVPKDGESLKDYTHRVYGPVQNHKVINPKQAVIDGKAKEFREDYTLKNGAYHIEAGYWAGTMDTYTLPNTTVQEAFLMAKLVGISFVKEISFPTKNYTKNNKEHPMDSFNVKVTNQNGIVTKVHLEGEYYAVTITKKDNGVELKVGGGT